MRRRNLPFSLALLLLVFVSSSHAWQGWTTKGGKTIDVPGDAKIALGADGIEAFVEELLAQRVAADGPGLALAIVLDGEIVYAGARGLADLERNVACAPDTPFDVASVSKSVTGAAIAALVEAGEVELDASVREYLPELSDTYAPVLVRHLVHHTGGVEDVQGTLALAGWRPDDPGTFADGLRVLSGLRHLRFEPGTQHRYSNGGYLLLAEVVGRAGGKPLPEWAAEHLFRQLGMTSATFATGTGKIVPGRALPYAEGPRRARASHRYGAGGLLCSVVDLARWAEALRTGEVIGDAVARRVRERGRLDDGSSIDYAFGLSRDLHEGRERWSHGGSVPGGQSFLAFYPDEALSIVAASNTLEDPNVARLVGEVVLALLGPGEEVAAPEGGPRTILITENQEAPEESRGVEVDPERVASCVGTYDLEDGLDVTFRARGAQLLIGFGASEPTIPLFPLRSGAFLLPQPGWEFRFEPEEDRVTLHVRKSARTGKPQDFAGKRRSIEPLDDERAAELVGTYKSDELNAFYSIAWRDGELRLEHARHGSMLLTPLGNDAYSLPGRALALLTFLDGGFELQAYSWGATSFFSRTK